MMCTMSEYRDKDLITQVWGVVQKTAPNSKQDVCTAEHGAAMECKPPQQYAAHYWATDRGETWSFVHRGRHHLE